MTATLRKIPAPDEYVTQSVEASELFEELFSILTRNRLAFGRYTTGQKARQAYRDLETVRLRLPKLRAMMMR